MENTFSRLHDQFEVLADSITANCCKVSTGHLACETHYPEGRKAHILDLGWIGYIEGGLGLVRYSVVGA